MKLENDSEDLGQNECKVLFENADEISKILTPY